MDSFPVRRGIGISRTPQAVPQFMAFHREPAPQQLPTKTMQPQITIMSRPAQQPVDLNPPRPHAVHSRTFSFGTTTAHQAEKGLPEVGFKEQSLNQGSVQLQLLQTLPKFIPFPNAPLNTQTVQQGEEAQTVEQIKAGNQQSPENRRAILTPQPNENSIFQVQVQPQSPMKVGGTSFKPETSFQPLQAQSLSVSEIPQTKLPVQTEQSPRWRLAVKQKEQLEQQLRQKTLQEQSWRSERGALVKQLQQKDLSIKQLQQRSSQYDQQLRGKVAALESELRLMKGNKNRLQIEIDSNKKLFKSERDKNEKARDQMNKLIFFEEDLIHAKDYNRLKEEVEYILAQNGRLFAEHQQYIAEVAEGRKATECRLKELQDELAKLKADQQDYEAKLQAVGQWGEERMVMLKLQSEINFLRKKCEDQVEQLRSKDAQLEEALQRQVSSQGSSILDEMGLRQINDAVSLYEARVADLSDSLSKSQVEAEKHRKTVELLTTELRRTREDRTITALRERSSENSLKNEVEMLQKGHLSEVELKNKRIANLEEALQRKGREIAEKDRFIKDFLITKTKQLDSNALQTVLQTIKDFFQPQPVITSQLGQSDL